MKVLTLNCRGLNNRLKRRSLYSQLKKFDIICLQETYITEDKASQPPYYLSPRGRIARQLHGLLTICLSAAS